MEIFQINKNKLHNRLFRLDPDFYKKKYIELEKIVKKNDHIILNEISFVTDGEHGTVKVLEKGHAKYFGARNIFTGFLENINVGFISYEDHEKNKKTILKHRDILLSCVGHVGNVSFVPKNIGEANIVRNVILVRPDETKINTSYLFGYFLSKYGKNLFARTASGNNQPLVSLENAKEILVPIFSKKLEKICEEILSKSENLLIRSQGMYNKAENYLLSETKLNTWIEKNELSYEKNFNQISQYSRIDSEYFQPKYDALIKKIKEYKGGWNTVKNLLNIKSKNFNPEHNKKYKYIELANININGEIIDCSIDYGHELPSRARRTVKNRDVIISSIEGSLDSIALVDEVFNNSLCSTGFFVCNSNFFNSETLLILMKSFIGQKQLKKGSSGTILTAINIDELNKIVLPKVDKKIQSKVKEFINEAYRLRTESNGLLTDLKNIIECAIERDELSALKKRNTL